MTIITTVVGVWLRNGRRHINLEWTDPKTEVNPYPNTRSLDVPDIETEFVLSDTVEIVLTRRESS